jgi:hypothetical protein
MSEMRRNSRRFAGFTFDVIAQEELFEPDEANVMGKTANP